MTSLYIPGRGSMDIKAWRVDAAVKDYDERLMFAKNEETGDWCIFIKMPTPAAPYPVLGFGDNIPTVDEARQRLRSTDTMRSGEAIYRDMVRSQEKYRANLKSKTDEAAEEAAEPIEFLMRKEGKSPITKVFYSKKGGDASDD